jgi:hypothetical protein
VSFFGKEGCMECDSPAGGLVNGDGKCNRCHGSGLEDFYDAAASAALGMEPSPCRRCGGDGICPRCGGEGEHD